MTRYLIYIGLIVLTLTAYSCQDKVVLPISDHGDRYFPVHKGDYWEYEVDSIVFDDFTGIIDSSMHLVREEITDTFRGVNGELNYRLEVKSKEWNKGEQKYGNWGVPRIWSLRKEEDRAVRVENGVSYVPMVFPLQQNKVWDGNMLNVSPRQLYKVNRFMSDTTFGAVAYRDLVEIVEQDQENLIEKQYASSIYASDTGRVYREIIDVKSNLLDSVEVPILERVTSGIIIKCRLISLSVSE